MALRQHQCAHIPLPPIQHFEQGILGERVKAGMVQRHGKPISRPKVKYRHGFNKRSEEFLKVSAGDISRRKAARELEIGYAILKRLLDSRANGGAA